MDKKQYAEEEKPKEPKNLMEVVVKLAETGEILISSTTDNDMMIVKVLIDAAQGEMERIVARTARNMRAMTLLNPINGGIKHARLI